MAEGLGSRRRALSEELQLVVVAAGFYFNSQIEKVSHCDYSKNTKRFERGHNSSCGPRCDDFRFVSATGDGRCARGVACCVCELLIRCLASFFSWHPMSMCNSKSKSELISYAKRRFAARGNCLAVGVASYF